MPTATLSLGPGLFDRRTRKDLNRVAWKLLPAKLRNNPAVWERVRQVCWTASYGEARDQFKKACQLIAEEASHA